MHPKIVFHSNILFLYLTLTICNQLYMVLLLVYIQLLLVFKILYLKSNTLGLETIRILQVSNPILVDITEVRLLLTCQRDLNLVPSGQFRGSFNPWYFLIRLWMSSFGLDFSDFLLYIRFVYHVVYHVAKLNETTSLYEI